MRVSTTGSDEGLRDALERTASELDVPGLFGLVAEAGRIIFAGTVGEATVGAGTTIAATDRFRIGSITKTFVATVVLQLAAGGGVDLGSPVEDWLPGVVPGGADITVEMLLGMRSGLPDYVPALLAGGDGLSVYDRYYPPQGLVELALSRPDRLEPGARRYSNTDYILLGLVVEQATGQRLEAQLWQRLFRPLGLTGTSFPEADAELRGPHATGYVRVTREAPLVEATTITPSEAWASGAIVATPGDVARFFDALVGGDLLPAPWRERMLSPAGNSAGGDGYGLGIMGHQMPDGSVVWGHSGGTPGFNGMVWHHPPSRRTVVYANCLDLERPLGRDTPLARQAFAATPGGLG